MTKKIGMVFLGCPKNQVDGEVMLAKLSDADFEIVNDVNDADVIIVNTCGFINDAKVEAIDNILLLAELKNEGVIKGIVVTGCLAQRYQDEIQKEIPEVDAVVGLGANSNIVEVCNKVFNEESVLTFPDKYCLPISGDRLLSTQPYTAFIKIAEGCSNFCTYCAIPKIRGKFRSRPIEEIVAEANVLAQSGVKELIVVAQDTTRYGIDLYGEFTTAKLLRELCKVNGIEWIRMLYCYPEAITDELLDVMATEEKICKYIDIPFQHASQGVLKKMNRVGSKDELLKLVKKIRTKIPDIMIRTTFIAGFPSETEEDFEQLCEFVTEAKFDRLGCFAYSPEDDTPAAKMPDQIDEDVKKQRVETIMNLQYRIFEDIQQSKIGKTMKVLVDEYDENSLLFLGRTYMDSPEIDSQVIISSEDELELGQFITVKIIARDDIDLIGEHIYDEHDSLMS